MTEKYKEITYFAGIDTNEAARKIITDSADVVRHGLSRDYGTSGLVSRFSLGTEAEYQAKVESLRKDRIAYCGEKAGFVAMQEDADFVNALDNPIFSSVYNAIETGVIRLVMSNIESNAINVIANVDTVGLGNSKTYNLDTKGLPVAQRNSYMSNVAFLNGVTSTPLTVTPKVYSLGIAMDLLRILKGDQDWAKETGKVIMGMLYAQYKLVVNTLFSTVLLTSTPFAPASFDVDDHVAIIDILTAVNKAPVVGYGTISALRKIGVGSLEIASSVYAGFQVQDQFVKDAFISHVNGIDYVRLNQAFDFSIPLEATLSAATAQMLIPTDKVILLSAADDKPVKLVREGYIRVRQVEPQDNSVLTKQYAYFMSFDAAIATMSQFAIQGV